VRVQFSCSNPDFCVKPTISIVGFADDDDGTWKADPILSVEAMDVESEQLQALWIEFDIPRHQKPGVFLGRIELLKHILFEDEELVGTIDVQIEVYDVTLPDPLDYTFYLDLWQHNANIARKHEVPLWSDAHFEILARYVSSLAKLGQKAVTVVVSEAPWSGQGSHTDIDYPSDLFEYSMVFVRRCCTGTWDYDFSAMDRYIELCLSAGINREIEVFGLVNIWQYPEAGYGAIADYPDAIRIRYFDERDRRFKFMRTEAEIAGYIKALEQHFRAKSWLQLVRVVADEPSDMELYQRRLAKLRQIAPGFRYKAAVNHVRMFKDITGLVDLVPILPFIAAHWDRVPELASEVPGRFLWYVCCDPDYPNTFIKSPLLESRLIPILTKYMRLDGFLRWNYTVWPERPRERLSFRSHHWASGDTNFVYPSYGGHPLLSLRYKLLLMGIQDFELLNMVETRYGAYSPVLKEYFRRILFEPDLKKYYSEDRSDGQGLYSLNWQDYEGARKLLLDALVDRA